MLIVRDIGVWSHYVGDGSQPQHVTEHHAGWDAYPDPMTYPPPGQPPEVKTIHNYFEGPFVKSNVALAAVRKAMTPYKPCNCAIEQRVPAYLKTSWAQIKPFYERVTSGDIKNATPRGVDFATARVHEAMAGTFNLSGSSVTSSASIGVATFRQAPNGFDHILKCADQLMYAVKNSTKDAVRQQEFSGNDTK